MSYGLITNYDLRRKVSSADLNRRADVLQAQLPGALRALGVGVLGIGDLLVDETLVAAGGAIIETSDTIAVPVYVQVPDALPLPARVDGENFLFLVLRVPETIGGTGDTRGTDSMRGAPPVLRASKNEDEPDALLLATWDAAQNKWQDARVLSLGALFSQLQSDLGFNATQRARGPVGPRLAALEGIGEGDNQTGPLITQVNSLKTQVESLAAFALDLEAKVNRLEGAAELFPQPFEILADEIAVNRAGVAEANAHAIERGQISAVVINAGHGQNDTPDYSPTTGDPLELPWDGETGTFGP